MRLINFVIVGGPKSNRWIGPLGHIVNIRLAALGASQKVTFFIASFKREDFVVLNEMFERGQVKPVVEQTYPLTQIASSSKV